MRALIDLLAPPVCDGCGALAPPPWCDACDDVAVAAAVVDPCPRCAGRDGVGHPCWDVSAAVEATVALSRWRDPVAGAVLRAKLEGRSEVFAALGPRLAALVPHAWSPQVVVPVPTDPSRVRERGADHTRVLARAVAGALGIATAMPLRTGVRVADRGAAVAGHRAPLPDGAIVVRRRGGAAVAGRRVLVVDDVLTTGGTLAAAARILRAAGATRVDAAVVARAGRHPLSRATADPRAPVAPVRAQK